MIASVLWPDDLPSWTRIWALLDGAREDEIYGRVLGTRLNRACLYSGRLPPVLEMAAPWLVELEAGDPFTTWLSTSGRGRSWGVFFRAEGPLEHVRKHLRRFLIVRDPAGRRIVFRYYDPRVLRVYLPTCNTEELRFVFGPIECFYTETENGEAMREFRFDGTRLQQREITS